MLTTEPVRYADGEPALVGLLLWDPSCSEQRPGILVGHGGGGLDDHARGRARRAGADYQILIYGQAMHGFTHETATGQTPGVAYLAPSDARSSIAIQSFLGEVIG